MMEHRTRLATALALTLSLTAGCSDQSIDDASLNSREDGVVSRLFGKLTGFFKEKAEEDVPVAPHEPWTPPEVGEDPAVDALFDTMGLEEVDPSSVDDSLDGALVGNFEYFDEDDNYEELCFFAKSHDQLPSEETTFWAEFYGFRSVNGDVSDIAGKAIGMECVWCEEGNTDGGETRVIFYVNGIRTTPEKHCDTLQDIANKTGGVTIGVMNESEGALKDVWQTGLDRFTVSAERILEEFGLEQIGQVHQNKAARMLMNLVIQRIRANKHVEIWAHSQGGAVTSLALHRALRQLKSEGLWPVMRDGEPDYEMIKVVTFGSAAPKWPEGAFPAGPRYTHYVHLRDATPSALGVGSWGDFITLGAKRAGGNAKMVFFDGEPLDLEDETIHPDERPDFTEIDVEAANTEFTDLNPTKYHHMDDCYLQMWSMQNTVWYR